MIHKGMRACSRLFAPVRALCQTWGRSRGIGMPDRCSEIVYRATVSQCNCRKDGETHTLRSRNRSLPYSLSASFTNGITTSMHHAFSSHTFVWQVRAWKNIFLTFFIVYSSSARTAGPRSGVREVARGALAAGDELNSLDFEPWLGFDRFL